MADAVEATVFCALVAIFMGFHLCGAQTGSSPFSADAVLETVFFFRGGWHQFHSQSDQHDIFVKI